MICPNCGNVLDETAVKCDYCGYELTNNLSTAGNVPNKKIPEQIPSANWVGPRRVAHICSISEGIQLIWQGSLLMGLEGFFSSLNSGMTAGTWYILFGIILIILGIVGLVKIHSSICCIILAVMYALAVLPFAQFKYLLIPRTDIFVAFFVALATMALCGAAYTIKGGVASGWIMLAILIIIIVYVNVYYDEIPGDHYRSEYEMTQNGYDSENDEWVQATATPTEPPQSVYHGQELIYDNSDYYNNNDYDEDYYDDDYDYDDDESEEDETEDSGDSDYIFSDSDTEYLTKADVKGMSEKELNLAKNELYARHGRIFDRDDLQDYFESCSWYEPLYTREEWDKKGDKYFFNKVEIKNRNFLVEREKKAKK